MYKKNLILFIILILLLTIFLFGIPSPLYADETTTINCTDYAYEKRPDLERGLGYAKYWADGARSRGFLVDNIPQSGDIAVFQPGDHGADKTDKWCLGGCGHVAYVESINSDGTFNISERNFPTGTYYNERNNLKVLPNDRFIHEKTLNLGLDTTKSQTNGQFAIATENNFFTVVGDWFKKTGTKILDGFGKVIDFLADVFIPGYIRAAEPSTAKSATIAASQESKQGIQGSVTTETTAPISPPTKPSLVSPYNWYQSLGTAPNLMWKGDSNSKYYYVVANSSNTGNVESGWIISTSWKPNLPNQNYVYSWKVKAKNSQGVEGPWSDESHFSITSTTLQFEGDISFNPPSPSSADQIKIFASTTGWGGVGVTLRVSVNTSPDGSSNGEWKILKELGVPKFNENDAPVWDTKGLSNGTYRIRVEAKGPNDPNWQNPAVIETTYTLVNKAEEQAEAKSVQKEGFSSCIILDEEYCNKGELIYYPGDYGIGFIGLGFTLPEGTKIYSPFKGLAEENVGIIVFGGSGLYGFDILDASDPEWGWKHQRDYLFVGGGVRTIIEIKPMFTENPVEKGQVIAEVTKNQKIITPDGKEYDIAITFMHYDADSNIWSYNEELLNKYFHYR